MTNQTNIHISGRIPRESPQLLPALLRVLADDLEQHGGKPHYVLGAGSLTVRIVRPRLKQARDEHAELVQTISDEVGILGL